MYIHTSRKLSGTCVSVLFSEPKIPQSLCAECADMFIVSFSALQRAENSSIPNILTQPKTSARFSALQRAENSSIMQALSNDRLEGQVSVLFSEPKIPQLTPQRSQRPLNVCFSALQRAENSSIVDLISTYTQSSCFSALQRAENSSILVNTPESVACAEVSVLFSEPKIPQSSFFDAKEKIPTGFSALQRAENSSIHQSSQKNSKNFWVSVLFSEPKIPQCALS